MDTSFFQYLRHLELIGFFSGYPLLYFIVLFLSGSGYTKKILTEKSKEALPLSYAIIGILFLGFQLRNFYPDYTYNNIVSNLYAPFLTVWGLLSILFLIPLLRKKSILSLLHSLVFFILLAKDIIQVMISENGERNQVKNDMRVYTVSLLLNLFVFFLTLLFISFFSYLRQKSSTRI